MAMVGIVCAIMYSVTESIIGTAVFVATVGVRQGSPTSCLLFIIVHVNDLIKLIKDNCINEGFLEWLHNLILMNDIVLLSTSRERMIHKLSLMKKFCCEFGMTVSESNIKSLVINGTVVDKEGVHIDGLEVEWCAQYMYLGWVTLHC